MRRTRTARSYHATLPANEREVSARALGTKGTVTGCPPKPPCAHPRRPPLSAGSMRTRQPVCSAARLVGPPRTQGVAPPATTARGAVTGRMSGARSRPSWPPLAAAISRAAPSGAARMNSSDRWATGGTASSTVMRRATRRFTRHRTPTPRTRVPAPVRPLSPAHCATKYDERVIRNVAVNEPPLAPAVTT